MSDFPEFYQRMAQQDLYLILGSQGSGTNLLSKFLHSLFNFSVVHDRSLIFNAAADIPDNPTPSQIQKSIHRVCSLLFPGPLKKRLLVKHYYNQAKNYAGIHRYLETIKIGSAEEFANFFYAYHTYTVGGAHKAIKSDDIWERLASLDRVCPRRKYLLLVRDPRDNALSILNKNFGPRDLYSASLYVKNRLRAYRDEIAGNEDRALVVNYETLLSNPRQLVDELAQKFDMKPVDDVEDRISDLRIRSTNFNKWSRLPAKDLAICESVLADELLEFGYTLQSQIRRDISWNEIMLWRTRDVLRRIPQRILTTMQNVFHP